MDSKNLPILSLANGASAGVSASIGGQNVVTRFDIMSAYVNRLMDESEDHRAKAALNNTLANAMQHKLDMLDRDGKWNEGIEASMNGCLNEAMHQSQKADARLRDATALVHTEASDAICEEMNMWPDECPSIGDTRTYSSLCSQHGDAELVVETWECLDGHSMYCGDYERICFYVRDESGDVMQVWEADAQEDDVPEEMWSEKIGRTEHYKHTDRRVTSGPIVQNWDEFSLVEYTWTREDA